MTIERTPEETAQFHAEMELIRLRGILRRIEALTNNPHWTQDRRWRIAELAAEGLQAPRTKAPESDP